MSHKNIPENLQWFNKARFGMFIHWGVYSLAGRGEWVRYSEAIPSDEYHAFAARFDPQRFDARAWARLAKEAGMKYMVLTTKHHDGYCLFDSKQTDFTSVKLTPGKDFVADYVAACREAGLGVGLYYSVKDWDFPAYFDGPEKNPAGWEKLVEHLHAQVRELLTNYGKIDILWYDCPDDANFRGGWGERTKDIWRAEELDCMVRAIQPHILTNNRSGLPGDFSTPEQEIPNAFYGTGFFECCMTMNDSWGYSRNGGEFKSIRQLLGQLITCAARGGNYLLNVGPDADGVIPGESVERLLEIGQWLRINGEAIYDTERLLPNWWDFTSTGRITTRGNHAWLIVGNWPENGQLIVAQLDNVIKKATVLATGESLSFRKDNRRWILEGLTIKAPSTYFSVIELELDSQARVPFYY